MDRALSAAAVGMAATVPMTASMVVIRRLLPPPHEREELPPRQITEESVDRTGIGRALDEEDRSNLTALTHFGYGAGLGLVYDRLFGGRRPTALQGALFGLGAWAVGYLGWIPALRYSPAAEREPASRNVMMVASHVVWGLSASWLQARRRRRLRP
jgi:hypothetical protein